MRTLLLSAALSIAALGSAVADDSVAGKWHADLGGAVTIDMTVGANGAWSSATQQNSKVVRQMQGTYKQMASGNGTGTLVFKPTRATVKSGKVTTETDRYELGSDGRELKLTSDGDTMVFEKQ